MKTIETLDGTLERMKWEKGRLEIEVAHLKAENARYRKALEFYKDQTNFSVYCYEVNPKTFGDDELGSHAREALRGK